MPKVLVNIDRVQVGDQDPDGVTFLVRVMPIISDATLRNALENQDFYVLETDDGQTPLQYYDLIISETRAFLLSVHGITIVADDVTILGWNDFRFYGTTSTELVEDFFGGRATSGGELGRFGWDYFDGWGWGVAMGSSSTTEHPGIMPVRSSTGTANTLLSLYHNAAYHVSRLEEIVVIVSPIAAANAVYLSGMSNSVSTITPTLGIQLAFENVGTTWRVNKRDISGLVTYTSTVTIVVGHWYRFRAILVSHNTSTNTMVWNYTIEDITAGTSWTQLSSNFVYTTTTFLNPSFLAKNTTTAVSGLDVDYWSIKVRDLIRTLRET